MRNMNPEMKTTTATTTTMMTKRANIQAMRVLVPTNTVARIPVDIPQEKIPENTALVTIPSRLMDTRL